MSDSVSTILTVLGAVIALFASAGPAIWNSRSERYLRRSRAFRELHVTFDSLSQVSELVGSQRAPVAHERFTIDLDLEARANAAMYLKAVGRLSRPGSFAKALVLIIYAAMMSAFSIATLFRSTESLLDAWIGAGVTGAIAVVLWWTGIAQLRRRLGTRWLRFVLGLAEPVSAEGVTDGIAALKRLAGRLSRQRPLDHAGDTGDEPRRAVDYRGHR